MKPTDAIIPRIAASACLLLACSNPPEFDGTDRMATAKAALAGVRGVGYYQSVDRSAFLNDGILSDVWSYTPTHRRVVTTYGVALINNVTGAFLAVPDSSLLGRGDPSVPNPDESNALVRAYFVANGLPEDQISNVHVTAMGVSEPRDPAAPDKRTFVAYYSHLQRRIQGVSVQESYAWARVDVAGKVVAEGVHWPTVPEAVVDSALRLVQVLANPQTAHGLLSKAAAGGYEPFLDQAEVVIHHSIGSFEGGSMEYVATVDVGDARKSSLSPRLSIGESGQRAVLNHANWPAEATALGAKTQ